VNYLQNLSALVQNAGQVEYATDLNFLAQLPVFIVSGEGRIIRDLDLLSTHVTDDAGTLDVGRRRFILPNDTATFIILENIRVVVGNTIQPALDWISHEAMSVVYPGEGPVGVPSIPRYVAPLDQFSVLIGPPPDQPYRVFCDGVQNPKSLSVGATITGTDITIEPGTPADNGTYISNYIPDLFIAAQMISVSAWMRNFSAMADDPKSARNWTEEYNLLKSGEAAQEARKTLEGQGWGSRQPSPIATPPQT
jgi:hypothetical protein